MNITLPAGPLTGTVSIPASKSQAHRLLICAALGDRPVTLLCDGLSRDILATIACLRAMGSTIDTTPEKISVTPGTGTPQLCHLPCAESGSTLRFLLPVAAAQGRHVVFHMEGRLPQRPMEALEDQLTAHGAVITRDGDILTCCGQLLPGTYTLPGNISSQYISGLLLALPLLHGDSTLTITGPTESAPYIAMTEDALRLSGVVFTKKDNTYFIPGRQHYTLPQQLPIEGDWSNAAFFLSAGAMSPTGMTVTGLSAASAQGDRAVLDILRRFGADVLCADDHVTVRRKQLHGITIDAAAIPDLIPVLSTVAAAAQGDTHIVHAERLRLKESDRLRTTAQLLTALGGCVEELPDGLIIHGQGGLIGGTVDACGDHRIAMSAAVAACICQEPVTITGSECVEKSYPRFWTDRAALKGVPQ